MKKVFAAFLIVIAMVFTLPVQAQSNFDFNKDFNQHFLNLTTDLGYEGVVVNIRTYLSIRSEATTNSRELTRIPNGTYLAVDSMTTYNGFYRVYYGRYTGYAHSSYIYLTGKRVGLP